MDYKNVMGNDGSIEIQKINVPKNNQKINMLTQDIDALGAQFSLGQTSSNSNNSVESMDFDEEIVSNSSASRGAATISAGKRAILDEQILNSRSEGSYVNDGGTSSNNATSSGSGTTGVQVSSMKPLQEIVLEDFKKNNPNNIQKMKPLSEQVLEDFRENNPNNIQAIKPFSEQVLDNYKNSHSLMQDKVTGSATIPDAKREWMDEVVLGDIKHDAATISDAKREWMDENVLNNPIDAIQSSIDNNARFYNFLNGNISTNMYDAAAGNFIDKERMNEKYWLDRELIFDEKSNGTYLISIIDANGNKVAMGYTDADSYNKYVSNGSNSVGGNTGSSSNVGDSSNTDTTNDNASTDTGSGPATIPDAKKEWMDGAVLGDIKHDAAAIPDAKKEWMDGIISDKVGTDTGSGPATIPDAKKEWVDEVVLGDIKHDAATIPEAKQDLLNERILNNQITPIESNVANNESFNSGFSGKNDFSQNTNSTVDYAQKYSVSNSYSGNGDFKLTTDNKIYTDMSTEDTLEVAAVVYAEAAPGLKPDDALAVASVIANREDSVRADTGAAWGGYQQGMKEVVAAPGQFSTYGGDAYNEFLSNYKSGIITDRMKMCLDAVEDVKNGIRNNDYQAFRSSASVAYSDNCVVDGGNRYKITAQV